MKILLLLLGWAIIGQGMWYAKSGVSKSKYSAISAMYAMSKRLARRSDEIVFQLGKYETDKMLEQLEYDAEQKKLRKLQPKKSMKIKLNTSADIPECHHPNTIIYKYTQPLEGITNVKFYSEHKRVYMVARSRKNILVKFMVCADEQMCKESYLQIGSVLKLDNHLVIFPPRFEDKFVSCRIEHPIGYQLGFETGNFEHFMKNLEDPPIPESDSSDFNLSSAEDSEQD